MKSLVFTRFSKTEDAMAQRAIERGVGLERKNEARLEVSTLVADYAAKNGIRRFGDRESGSYDAVRSYLLDRGYQVKYVRNRYEVKKLGTRGRGATMTWAKIVEMSDELRIGEGREPLKRRAA